MQQSSRKEVQEQGWLGGEGDPLGILPGTKTWPNWQIVYAQTRICSRK